MFYFQKTNLEVFRYPYNTQMAQLMEVQGSVGHAQRMARTVLLGDDLRLLTKVIFVLSYFVRCSILRTNRIAGECFILTVISVVSVFTFVYFFIFVLLFGLLLFFLVLKTKELIFCVFLADFWGDQRPTVERVPDKLNLRKPKTTIFRAAHRFNERAAFRGEFLMT